LQDDEGMEAAKLEGVHSGLSRSDCRLRHLTSTLTPANATVPDHAWLHTCANNKNRGLFG
jgi:hypothetical protein